MTILKLIKQCFFCCVFVLSISVYSQDNVFDVSRTGTVKQIEALYKVNPDVITLENDQGYTPLILACYNGNLEVVKFLVSKLENIDAESKYGTPLMAAIYKGYTDIVKILLDHNADTSLKDDKGETASHYAVFFKKYDIIKLLVEANADFHIKNMRNQTAVDYAKMYNEEQINYLLNL